jgi:uncharacterized protein YkwD
LYFFVYNREEQKKNSGGKKMVKFCKFLLVFVVAFGLMIPNVSAASSFKDVGESHWAYKDIKTLVEMGSINGFKDGTFRPNDPVTKAQAAKIVYKLKGMTDKPAKQQFTDVPKNFWAYNEIGVLTEQMGFQRGTKFYPNKALTRAEMAMLIVEIFNLEKNSSKVFTDVKKEEWYFGYVNKLYTSGVTKGVSTTKFDPEGRVTRAQIAAFLNRALKVKKEEVVQSDLLTTKEIKEMQSKNLELVNKIRVKNGKSEIAFSEKHSEIAMIKAKEMYDKKYYDHILPTYGDVYQMYEKFGIVLSGYAENILMGYTDTDYIVKRWEGSPGHKENMLGDYPSETKLAIGIYGSRYSDQIYWVNIFVTE